jgi:hypothetical protein
MFDETMPSMATRYLYSWPDGQACFFETAGVIYTMAGRPTYYVDDNYVYVFDTGKPAFSIRDKYLYPFPAGSQPSYYFGN